MLPPLSVLYSAIAVLFTSAGYLGIRGCASEQEATALRAELQTTKDNLQRCSAATAVVQAELAKQTAEINNYNIQAQYYKKQLETKYTLPPALSQPCTGGDFSFVNGMLMKQGSGR